MRGLLTSSVGHLNRITTKSSKNNWEHAYLTAYEEKRGVCERLPNGLMMRVP